MQLLQLGADRSQMERLCRLERHLKGVCPSPGSANLAAAAAADTMAADDQSPLLQLRPGPLSQVQQSQFITEVRPLGRAIVAHRRAPSKAYVRFCLRGNCKQNCSRLWWWTGLRQRWADI